MRFDSTRQAIHDALAWGYLKRESGLTEYLTYLCKIDKSGTTRDNCVDMLEAGYILAAISKLPPHIQSWIRFGYGYDDSRIIQSVVASYIRFHLWPISEAKKHERLIAMAKKATEDYRLRVWQNKQMPIIAYCQDMGVNEKNFKRDWGNRLDQCLDLLKLMDSDGVGRISPVVKALKGQAEVDGKPVGPSVMLDL